MSYSSVILRALGVSAVALSSYVSCEYGAETNPPQQLDTIRIMKQHFERDVTFTVPVVNDRFNTEAPATVRSYCSCLRAQLVSNCTTVADKREVIVTMRLRSDER
jgi:hypothetical protein